MLNHRNIRSVLLGCALLLVAPAALAGDDPDTDRESKIVIVRDDGDEVVVDIEAINEIVNEAMDGVSEAMAELEEMQFEMHLGQDNRLNLSYDDTTMELDLDQVMSQVAMALEAGFDNFDVDAWTDSRERWDSASESELREELEQLKKEMRALKRDLRRQLEED